MYALSWFLILGLIAAWSLTTWAANAIAVWTVSNAGVLTGAATGAASGVESLNLPQWLAPWVPPELAQTVADLLTGVAPAIESLLAGAPALAGGVTMAMWVVWAIGSALLLLLGAGLHLLIALWRRRGAGGGPAANQRVAV